MRKINLILVLSMFTLVCIRAQHVAVKTNVLYDASSTINLGVEAALSKHVTLELSGNYNPWTFANDKSARHWMLQPELRYWTHDRFNGHFFGVHGLYGTMETNGLPFMFGLNKDYGYDGLFGGGGLSYGYQLYLSPRWNMEFTAGAGYVCLDYNKTGYKEKNAEFGNFRAHYWGVTKLGVSIVYIIK